MPEQSRFHFPTEWAKERLDEMDAALASLDRLRRSAISRSAVAREAACTVPAWH
jgi:hypothetical protein